MGYYVQQTFPERRMKYHSGEVEVIEKFYTITKYTDGGEWLKQWYFDKNHNIKSVQDRWNAENRFVGYADNNLPDNMI